jgi:hypothetical protein
MKEVDQLLHDGGSRARLKGGWKFDGSAVRVNLETLVA